MLSKLDPRDDLSFCQLRQHRDDQIAGEGRRRSRDTHIADERRQSSEKRDRDAAKRFFRVKRNMPKIGGFQSFNTARRTIAGFEAMLWLRKGFGFTGSGASTSRTIYLVASSDFKRVTKYKY